MIDAKNKLNEVNTSLEKVLYIDFNSKNVSSENHSEKKNEVQEYREEFELESDEIEKELEEQLEDIEEEKQRVKDRKEENTQKRKKISDNYNSMNCEQYDNKDLSNHTEEPDELNETLIGLENPTCSLLYTMLIQIDEESKELNITEKNLDESEKRLEKIQTEFSSFEEGIMELLDKFEKTLESQDSLFTEITHEMVNVEKEIDKINSERDSLSNNFGDVVILLDNGTTKFDNFSQAYLSINKKINDISGYSPESLVDPVASEIKPLVAENNTLFYIFPSFLIMMISFTCILIGTTITIKEKISKTLIRNLISPVNDFIFIFGTYISCILIVLIQILIIVLIAQILFSLNVFSNLILFFLVLFASLLFTSIGIIIGNILKNEETAVLTSIIIFILFLLFSNLVIPKEKMSENVEIIVKYSPYLLFETIFKRNIIFGIRMNVFFSNIVILTLEFLILFAGTYLSSKYARHQYLSE
jgi:ABC-type multidrug transport system permease subunit